jgi:hypothetical protein
MPIPFILGGIALLAAGFGAKKGYDAYEDYDIASNYNEKAEIIYNKAKKDLELKKEETNKLLEELGKLKVSIYEGSLMDFIDIFEEIKNIDFNDGIKLENLINIDKQDILDIKNTVLEMKEVLGGGILALGGGALAGFGALGGVGMLASASTGTAIATLSGAAATNATLAWLGGGALSAGGFGMAGGMVVLGGIVAGPVLAIGGFILASKAEEAKYKAYGNYDEAKAIAEQINTVIVVLDGIHFRTLEFIDILEPLNDDFETYIEKMEDIVYRSKDYSKYSQSEKQIILTTASIAKTVKNICDSPIIDENGEVARKSKRVLKKAKEFSEKLKEVINVTN